MTKGLCKNVFDNFKAKLYSVFGIKTLQGFETLEEFKILVEFNNQSVINFKKYL